jgi:hypothetical protein
MVCPWDTSRLDDDDLSRRFDASFTWGHFPVSFDPCEMDNTPRVNSALLNDYREHLYCPESVPPGQIKDLGTANKIVKLVGRILKVGLLPLPPSKFLRTSYGNDYLWTSSLRARRPSSKRQTWVK